MSRAENTVDPAFFLVRADGKPIAIQESLISFNYRFAGVTRCWQVMLNVALCRSLAS